MVSSRVSLLLPTDGTVGRSSDARWRRDCAWPQVERRPGIRTTGIEPPETLVLGRLGNDHVFHEAQGHTGFSLERGARSTVGQSQDLPWPKGRQHPFDDVARGVSLAFDLALFIDFISAADGNHIGGERQVCHRKAKTIKFNNKE